MRLAHPSQRRLDQPVIDPAEIERGGGRQVLQVSFGVTDVVALPQARTPCEIVPSIPARAAQRSRNSGVCWCCQAACSASCSSCGAGTAFAPLPWPTCSQGDTSRRGSPPPRTRLRGRRFGSVARGDWPCRRGRKRAAPPSPARGGTRRSPCPPQPGGCRRGRPARRSWRRIGFGWSPGARPTCIPRLPGARRAGGPTSASALWTRGIASQSAVVLGVVRT